MYNSPHRRRLLEMTVGARFPLPFSGGSRNWLWGAHGERVEREPITGVWGWSPQRGPGAEPLVGGLGGKALLKLKALELSSIQWKWKNALFSLLCNHNKLGYLRSEPKPNVPLRWGSRGAYPPEAERIFDLWIGTYNGSCKFWALAACAPWIRHWSRGRAPVGVQGGLTSRCWELRYKFTANFQGFFTINVNLSN